MLKKGMEMGSSFIRKIEKLIKEHKKTTTIICACTILAIALLVILLAGKTKDLFDKKTVSILDDKNYIPITTVNANVKNNILANNSRFTVETHLDYELEDVKELIYLEPAIDYSVKKIASKKYEIIPKENLSDNTVYTVGAVRDETVVYRWSFQTQKKLSVSATYPRNEYEYADIDTSIEITFSYPEVLNIEEYFEIEPKVEGEFTQSSNKYTWIFLPSETLKSDTTYTVTVKKGLKNNLQIMEEDYVFSFKTSEDWNNRSPEIVYDYYNIDNSYTFTSDIIPIIKLSGANDNINANVVVYNLGTADNYIANNKKKDNIDLSKLTKETSFSAKTKDNFINFPNSLKEGYYLVSIKINKEELLLFMQINNLVTYVSNMENETLVWVNNYTTGKAIKDLVVNLNGNQAKTDSDGIAVVKARNNNEKYSYLKVGTNSKTPYIVLIHNYGHDSYSSYNTYPTSYIYSDRTLYKRTDTIKIFGFIPKDRFNGNPNGVFKVELSNYNDIYASKNITVDSNGLFSTEISIADYNDSMYLLNITYNGKTIASRDIEVYNFEKPNYVYTITTDKIFYNRGDIIKATVEVEHISGMKVPYKKILVIDSNDKEHIVTTDANGKATFDVKVKTTEDWTSVSLDYFALYISSGDVEETSDYAAVAGAGIVSHNVLLNVSSEIKDDKTTLTINTNKAIADNLNAKYGSYNYYISSDEYKGAAINRPVAVEIEEIIYTKTRVGTKYNPITKKSEPEYNYEYNNNIVKTYNLQTTNGVVILPDLEYKNEETETYEKYYYANIETTDTYNNVIREWLSIGSRESASDTGMTCGSYSDSTHYYFKTDKDKYLLNEDIYAKLSGLEGYSVDSGEILSFFYKYGVADKKVDVENDIKLSYNTKVFSDAILNGAYFDGKRVYKVLKRHIDYDESEQELKIDIKTNKDDIAPGEEITVNISVKDQSGKGKKTSVNLSVVDDAVFMIKPDSTNILESIYSQNYYHNYSFASYYDFNNSGGGCGDARTKGPLARKDFKDTVYFQIITTDNNGNATVKIKFPDNITAWRITAHAISGTNLGVNTKLVTTSLPFFIEANVPDSVKSTDDFVINVTGFGNLKGKIKYEVTVDNVKQNKEGIIGGFIDFNFGNLTVGEHKIKITGSIGSSSDSLEYNFTVKETFADIPITSVNLVKDSLNIKPTASPVILEFYHKDLGFYMSLLDYLNNTRGERLDLELANQKAMELKNKYYEEKEEINIIKLNKYQTPEGMILLKGDTPSLALSALIGKYGKKHVDIDSLKSLFYETIINESADETDIYAAYMGLASLREPVLFDLNYLKSELRTNITESIYLALSYAFIGDYSSAMDIYKKEVRSKSDYLNKEPYLIAILTSMIETDTSKNLINKYIDSKEYNEYYTFAIISYIENTIPVLDEKSSIDIDLKGTKEHIEINKMRIKKLIVDKQEVDDIKINASKDVYVKTTYLGSYKNIDRKDIKYIIKSTINQKIKKGNIAKLNIAVTNYEPDTWSEIKIVLPNGLRLNPGYDVKTKDVYIKENKNDYLIFNAYSKGNTLSFDVELVGISKGKFELEPIILTNDYKYGVSNNNIIVIE